MQDYKKYSNGELITIANNMLDELNILLNKMNADLAKLRKAA